LIFDDVHLYSVIQPHTFILRYLTN
jgi:hypothetical protein